MCEAFTHVRDFTCNVCLVTNFPVNETRNACCITSPIIEVPNRINETYIGYILSTSAKYDNNRVEGGIAQFV